MFSITSCTFLCVFFVLWSPETCASDIPHLLLYSPGDVQYTDVLVKRVNDNLTLICELQGDNTKRRYVWNYVASDLGNVTDFKTPYTVDTLAPSNRSTLYKTELQISDSGHYMCSAPPFSVTKYIVVQNKGAVGCARGALSCGFRCVLPAYVCDGRTDCADAEDEHPLMCGENVCMRSDRLNCSDGRCVPAAACCGAPAALCRQPACCNEHPSYSRLEGPIEVEYPQVFDDRHAPDDYGFIQSTIYTVTACALIFMIAVVLLISAICKMHMKRAALRSYAHAERATRRHYSVHYAQTQRFPPCYEASRLLEDGRAASPAHSPHDSPARQNLQCNPGCPPAAELETRPGFGLASLSAIFSSRYRQVPLPPAEVEMNAIRASSTSSSIQNYRSPTYCDLQEELFASPESQATGRDLNYMAAPLELFRRRARSSLDRQRLTLQLGRFQLTLPFRDRRPDTPNVSEVDDEDTYTLNGRTIRLLGADLENYPVVSDGIARPPPYAEAVRYKLFGPPPEYLSREALNLRVDMEARTNVEMPPRYDDLASGASSDSQPRAPESNGVAPTLSSVIDDLPDIDNDAPGTASSLAPH
ncbi:uncharacterized protein LOC114246557 [Bombyx mandarina]|uniref:Uncharacterized protein LOC114246557 n=1 Tax=Bombyx mandarina TaxID=7092 RepID=A0A6J2K3Q3_BOMMA|nr:uncharacterized protein LOC114246557 [Bombyx mandarina]